jgi:ketosteroid isomerase-like protein
MSEPNVVIVRAAIDAINRRDWEGAFENAAPEFEYDLSRTESLLRGVYSRDQMSGVIEEFLDPWDAYRYEPHEFIEAGDHVVVPFTTHFRGRDGIEVEGHATFVWTVRERVVARLALYQDLDEALEAAGARPRSAGRLGWWIRRLGRSAAD